MNDHFAFHLETSCKTYSYSYQIIEKLPGTGYRNDGSIDKEMSKVRKDKEDIWIKKMRTLFPYGLCEKARDKVNDCSMIHEAVGNPIQDILYLGMAFVLHVVEKIVTKRFYNFVY